MAPPTLHDAAVALLGTGRSAFLAGYKFDIRPATDDRPFFYRFFTWNLLPELVALRRQGGLVFVDADISSAFWRSCRPSRLRSF